MSLDDSSQKILQFRHVPIGDIKLVTITDDSSDIYEGWHVQLHGENGTRIARIYNKEKGEQVRRLLTLLSC
ncbi:hypothetical protein M422DRAFT_27285 [Sphaerobolus stellatus SS14]|nr:hypothetical protein M422DRAFT_27285 [Sphaerobolus stellatus SS14]